MMTDALDALTIACTSGGLVNSGLNTTRPADVTCPPCRDLLPPVPSTQGPHPS